VFRQSACLIDSHATALPSFPPASSPLAGFFLKESPVNTYIGTKIIQAEPMTRLAYNELRGWTVPADENPADDGYLVEYLDGGKPNVLGFAGYVSWSPKEQFEKAYITVGDVSGLLPHQVRVKCEAAELDKRIEKLTAFQSTELFHYLPSDEQYRLIAQLAAMQGYSKLLAERIAAFGATA